MEVYSLEVNYSVGIGWKCFNWRYRPLPTQRRKENVEVKWDARSKGRSVTPGQLRPNWAQQCNQISGSRSSAIWPAEQRSRPSPTVIGRMPHGMAGMVGCDTCLRAGAFVHSGRCQWVWTAFGKGPFMSVLNNGIGLSYKTTFCSVCFTIPWT